MKFKKETSISSFNDRAAKQQTSRLNDFINAFEQDYSDLSAMGNIARPNHSASNNKKI